MNRVALIGEGQVLSGTGGRTYGFATFVNKADLPNTPIARLLGGE